MWRETDCEPAIANLTNVWTQSVTVLEKTRIALPEQRNKCFIATNRWRKW